MPDARSASQMAADVVAADVAAASVARPGKGPVLLAARTSMSMLGALAVAVLVVLAIIGFAVTRPNVGPAPAPAFTLPPPPTAATAPAQVPVTAPPAGVVPFATVQMGVAPGIGAGGVGPFGPKCPHPWGVAVMVTVSGAKAGDQVHIVLTGPDLPPSDTGTLDANLSYTTQTYMTTQGTGTWTAHVDTVAGRLAGSTTAVNTETCN